MITAADILTMICPWVLLTMEHYTNIRKTGTSKKVLPSLRSNNKNCSFMKPLELGWCVFFITALVCNVHTYFPSGVGRRSECTSPRSRLCPPGSYRWPCVSPVAGTTYRIPDGHPRSGPGPRPPLSNQNLLVPLKKKNAIFFQRQKNIYVKIIVCLGNCTTSTDKWHDCVISWLIFRFKVFVTKICTQNMDFFSPIPTHQFKRFRLGISLLWPLTDLVEVVTCVPPWEVWSDHRSPVVEGTEPHLSVAVNGRKERNHHDPLLLRNTGTVDVALLTPQSHRTGLLSVSTLSLWSHPASPSKPLWGSSWKPGWGPMSRLVLWLISLCHCPVGTALWQPSSPASSDWRAQVHKLAWGSMKRCLGGLWGYSASFCSQGSHYSSGRIPPAN